MSSVSFNLPLACQECTSLCICVATINLVIESLGVSSRASAEIRSLPSSQLQRKAASYSTPANISHPNLCLSSYLVIIDKFQYQDFMSSAWPALQIRRGAALVNHQDPELLCRISSNFPLPTRLMQHRYITYLALIAHYGSLRGARNNTLIT